MNTSQSLSIGNSSLRQVLSRYPKISFVACLIVLLPFFQGSSCCETATICFQFPTSIPSCAGSCSTACGPLKLHVSYVDPNSNQTVSTTTSVPATTWGPSGTGSFCITNLPGNTNITFSLSVPGSSLCTPTGSNCGPGKFPTIMLSLAASGKISVPCASTKVFQVAFTCIE